MPLHFDFLIPHNGRYRLFVATRLSGVRDSLAGQDQETEDGNDFRW
ncbi:hypothetical protein [Malonomonas rubra]|nr:hypothetical protein [Malonomonas rubra]